MMEVKPRTTQGKVIGEACGPLSVGRRDTAASLRRRRL